MRKSDYYGKQHRDNPVSPASIDCLAKALNPFAISNLVSDDKLITINAAIMIIEVIVSGCG